MVLQVDKRVFELHCDQQFYDYLQNQLLMQVLPGRQVMVMQRGLKIDACLQNQFVKHFPEYILARLALFLLSKNKKSTQAINK